MAFFQILPQSPGSRIAEQLGLSIGQGIGNLAQQRQQAQAQSQLAQRLFGPEQAQQYSGIPMDAMLKAAQIEASKEIAANKPPPGGVTAQPTPPEISQKIPKVLNENKNATSDELAVAFDQAGIPRTFSNSYIENRRRAEELGQRREEKQGELAEKSLMDYKKDVAEKATIAEDAIRNKEKLMGFIDTGNLDNPTYAAIATALPFKLGERMLSPETAAYRSAIIDEYGVLRKLFKGQTRAKELDLLENKIADIYLTDDQKKAILKSAVDATKIDILRRDAALEIEEENIGKPMGLLKYQKMVEGRIKDKIAQLSDKIIDEQKFIIDQAEKMKKYPLKYEGGSPEQREIIRQIYMEAGGNVEKAKEIARKKGYKFEEKPKVKPKVKPSIFSK